jgi:hypothetical protein
MSVQPGDVRVHRANLLRRIGRFCYESVTPALPAPSAVTFYGTAPQDGIRLDFDAVADAEAWARRFDTAPETATGTHAWFATATVEGVYTELVVWADAVAEVVHETRTEQLPGGPIRVWCSCGWEGVAPSKKVAERDAEKHREGQS